LHHTPTLQRFKTTNQLKQTQPADNKHNVNFYDVNFLILLMMAMGGTPVFSASDNVSIRKWSLLFLSRICLIASMTSATLIPLGQRVLQVIQEAQIQMDLDCKSSCLSPSWAYLMIWLGSMSIWETPGHPAEHFPHW
jgi:DMSO reductase anchor subunit